MKKSIIFLLVAVLLISVGCSEEKSKAPEPADPDEFAKQVVGQDEDNLIDKSSLEVISRVHSLLNNAVGWENSPSDKQVEQISEMIPEIEKIIEKTNYKPLKEDLERFLKLVDAARPNERDDWIMPHRIVHDIDHFLLGRSTKENTEYWGESEAVKTWMEMN
ncbi:hypothetical protein PRVXH_001746 [Proteinivorax hydrogeniformans]|uniref:Lipoprotein n=1 Tax=Proteinivorax hydrogeniformans TaxID=1826727 RepID=A0AAU8HRK0_9FIRM